MRLSYRVRSKIRMKRKRLRSCYGWFKFFDGYN